MAEEPKRLKHVEIVVSQSDDSSIERIGVKVNGETIGSASVEMLRDEDNSLVELGVLKLLADTVSAVDPSARIEVITDEQPE